MKIKNEADMENLIELEGKVEKNQEQSERKKIEQLKGHSRRYFIQMNPRKRRNNFQMKRFNKYQAQC